MWVQEILFLYMEFYELDPVIERGPDSKTSENHWLIELLIERNQSNLTPNRSYTHLNELI